MEVKVIFADGFVYVENISPISSINEVVQDALFAHIDAKGLDWKAFNYKNIKSVLVNGTRWKY